MNYGRPKDLSEQSIFDTVARHMLTQGKKSIDIDAEGRERCRYRGSDGLACAVGCLLTAEEAKEADRPKGATGGSAPWIDMRLWPQFADIAHVDDLLQALQVVHDKSKVENWASGLITVAHQYGLDPDVPTQWRINHASK